MKRTYIWLVSSEYIDGELVLTDTWQAASNMERLDLLQDYIGLLQRLYGETLQEWRDSLVDKGAKP